MRKILIILTTFVIYINAHGLNLTVEEKEYLATKKVIKVHNEKDWAPYNFNENGKPKGFSIDYMNLLAKKLGIKIDYISGYSWSQFLDLIKNNKIDVIVNIAKTEQRSKYINFTKPFIQSKKAIFSNLPHMKKISDLNGKVVAVPKKFFIHDYLMTHYPKIKIKTYKNIQECLYAVVNKEVDALIENYAVVNYQIIKNGLVIKYIAITDDKELKTDISLGIAKSESILKNILEKAQNAITKNEFEKLENKWFGVINKIMLETKGITIYDELVPHKIITKNDFLNIEKTINMCVDPNWMPMEKIDRNGKYIGIISDYSRLISQKANINFNLIKTTSFKDSIEYLKKGKCDILMAEVATSHMKKNFLATKPYFIAPRAFVTHNDIPWISDFAYILKQNKKIGILKNSPAKFLLTKMYNNIKLVEYKNTELGLKAVSSKEIIAFVNIMPVIAYTMQKNILSDIKIAGYINQDVQLSILINKKLDYLLPILNSAIDIITEQERLDIFAKWIKVKFEKKVDYRYLWQIVGTLLLLILIAIYINYRLKLKVANEINKNKQQQLLMLQQSRLAQMGEMISMIAHQWRQPLNSLSLLNQALILKYGNGKLDDKFISYFKENSKKQIQNMSSTIDDFRDFFKPQKEKDQFYINDVVSNTLDMIKPIFTTHSIKINFDTKKTYEIIGYPNELGQAILNIVNNSKDALIQNGIKNKTIDIILKGDEKKVILTIKDNAGGIPKNIMDKIFDPYFSTKEEKNGTGLGLYMTKIIIQEHLNGKIEVENKDSGVSFSLILPTSL